MLTVVGGAFRFYRVWVAAVLGYLIGCVLTADIAARLANRRNGEAIDLRAVGSGNPGGANAFVNLGKGWGVGVIAGDIAKGAIGAAAGRAVAGDAGAYAAATAAVAGHCYPALAGFRGGKGVGTSAGTTLVCFPVYVPFDVALVVGSYFWSRHAARATYIASTLFCLAAAGWRLFGWPNAWGTRPTWGLPLYALATTMTIFSRFLMAPPHMGDRTPAAPAETAQAS
ncbi:MAG: glycerol-3-phosphate acyltransferase [Dehalococcoidia bacterium]